MKAGWTGEGSPFHAGEQVLKHLVGGTKERLRYPRRRVWFIHGVRHGGEHAFGREVRALAERNPDLTVHVRYESPRAQDVAGEHYDSIGRVDAELLRRLSHAPILRSQRTSVSASPVMCLPVNLASAGAASRQFTLWSAVTASRSPSCERTFGNCA